MHGKRVVPRRVVVWLLVSGLALVLIGLGYRAWRIWRAARPLLARVETVRALAADPSMAEVATLEPLVRETHAELAVLRDEAHPFLTVLPRLGWVPGIGPDLRALPPLLDIAVDLTGAGEAAITGLAPLLNLMEAGTAAEGEDPLALAVHALVDARPQLETAQEFVACAIRRRAAIDVAQLSPRLADAVDMLDHALPLAQAGVEASLLAPDLMGLSGPRTYLLLAQNSDELRPTGGFISGAGCVTLDGGAIVALSFCDAYLVDDFSKPYDEPPAPLYEYMLSELWLFRDANWSPDFPTSARKVAEFYTYGQGVELDGVIAFDQQGAGRLIEALGPVSVEGWDEPTTGENFAQVVRQAWNPASGEVTGEWGRTRKDFMNKVMQAVLEQVMRRPETVDWFGLGRALWQTMEERHLLIYSEEPAVASWLRARNWDGALRPVEGDYLMVVDANLGFNKADPSVERALDYAVALRADGSASAELEVTYHHAVPESDRPCSQRAVFRPGERITYENLMEGCYWNYLRVYVPEGSRLWTASRHPVPAEYLLRGTGTTGETEVLPVEGDKAGFAQFFVVERGQLLKARFCYDLPQVAHSGEGQHHYALLIQKQPGTDSTPVSLTIALPPGAQLLAATPSPRVIDGEVLTFDLDLDTDIVVAVSYEQA